jgi:hypothetical protein
MLYSAAISPAKAQEMVWGGKTVNQWVDITKDPRREVREEAVRALGYCGPDARSALPVLKTLLNDPDPGIRDAADRAINNVMCTPRKLRPAVDETAAEPTYEVPALQGNADVGQTRSGCHASLGNFV